jgi:hypothetical protein
LSVFNIDEGASVDRVDRDSGRLDRGRMSVEGGERDDGRFDRGRSSVTTATAEVDASPGDRPAPAPPVPAAFAYLDVALVVLALPVVVLAGAPLLGYCVAAAAWLVQRGVGVLIDRYAVSSPNPRTGLIAALAGLFLRLWMVTLAVIVAARAGDRSDGLTAAIVVAVAFTVYLALELVMRPHAMRAARARREDG